MSFFFTCFSPVLVVLSLTRKWAFACRQNLRHVQLAQPAVNPFLFHIYQFIDYRYMTYFDNLQLLLVRRRQLTDRQRHLVRQPLKDPFLLPVRSPAQINLDIMPCPMCPAAINFGDVPMAFPI